MVGEGKRDDFKDEKADFIGGEIQILCWGGADVPS